jgi:hypothetical protein
VVAAASVDVGGIANDAEALDVRDREYGDVHRAAAYPGCEITQ